MHTRVRHFGNRRDCLSFRRHPSWPECRRSLGGFISGVGEHGRRFGTAWNAVTRDRSRDWLRNSLISASLSFSGLSFSALSFSGPDTRRDSRSGIRQPLLH